MLILDVYFKD